VRELYIVGKIAQMRQKEIVVGLAIYSSQAEPGITQRKLAAGYLHGLRNRHVNMFHCCFQTDRVIIRAVGQAAPDLFTALVDNDCQRFAAAAINAQIIPLGHSNASSAARRISPWAASCSLASSGVSCVFATRTVVFTSPLLCSSSSSA